MVSYKKFILSFSLLLLMVGCGGPSPEEEIYNHLEKAVTLEEVFEDQQQPLVELEEKEQEKYNQIIQLGMSEFEQIISLSQEALTIVEQREERIDKEKESINASKAEFELVSSIIDTIEDTEVKTKAEELSQLMSDRYSAYETLYNNYKDAIALDKELYEIFQNEELKLEELESQIAKINNSYEQVLKSNEEFNAYTEDYNKVKKEFYQLAGLNVVFENGVE